MDKMEIFDTLMDIGWVTLEDFELEDIDDLIITDINPEDLTIEDIFNRFVFSPIELEDGSFYDDWYWDQARDELVSPEYDAELLAEVKAVEDLATAAGVSPACSIWGRIAERRSAILE